MSTFNSSMFSQSQESTELETDSTMESIARRQRRRKTENKPAKKTVVVPSAPRKREPIVSRISLKQNMGEGEEEYEMLPKRKKLTDLFAEEPEQGQELPPELEEGEIEDERVEEEEGQEQAIQVPEGHTFLGDWRGASVKQSYGSIVAALHVYKMKKSHRSGAPLVGRNGKILTQTSKYEFTLKEQELIHLYKVIPALLLKMKSERKKLAKAD